MRDIKQQASPDFATWQRQVDCLNSLREVKRVALDVFGLRRRHGHHKDNADVLLKQSKAIRTALSSTCFVLRSSELTHSRVPRAQDNTRADIRAMAMHNVMPWLITLVTKLRNGTDCDLMFDDENELSAVNASNDATNVIDDLDDDADDADDADNANENDDDAFEQTALGSTSLVFAYVN